MNHLESAYKGKNKLWKYLLMLLVIPILGQVIGAIPIYITQVVQCVNLGIDISTADALNFSSYGINLTFGLFLLLIPFMLSLLLFVKFFKPLHNRHFATVINGTSTIRWRRIIIGFAVWGVIMAFVLVVDYYLNIDNYEVRLSFRALIPLAFVSLLFIPFQAFYEEILIRGYMAQGVGRLTKNRFAVIFIPSLFFALLHGTNPEIQKFGFWAMMPQYFTIAVIYALVSVFDDGIELAMGAHAANNAFLSIFVTSDGTVFQTDALLKMLELNPEKEFVTLLIGSLVFMGALAFKYKWSFKTLISKITEPKERIIGA